jgi:hypothetical protein
MVENPQVPELSSPPPTVENPQTQTILVSEFLAYIKHRFPEYKCPTCGENAISPVSLPGDTVAAQLHLMVGMGYVPSLGVVCSNCAHIDLFYWQIVYGWIKEQAGKND